MAVLTDLEKKLSNLFSGAGNSVLKTLPLVGSAFTAANLVNRTPGGQLQINKNASRIANTVASNPVVKKIASSPLISIPGINSQAAPFSPTIGESFQGRIVKPIVNMFSSGMQAGNENLSFKDRVLAAANAGINTFNMSPAGMAANASFAPFEAAKSAVEAARTKKPINKAISESLAGNRTTGLGDAATSNKTLAGALNMAELPLTLAAGPAKNKAASAIAERNLVVKKNYLEKVVDYKKNIQDLALRFEKTFGSLSDPANPKMDTNLYDDAVKVWRQLHGNNRNTQPPKNIDEIIGQIKQTYQGAMTELRMMQEGSHISGNNIPKMGIADNNISSEGVITRKGKLKTVNIPTQTEIKNRAEISYGNPDLYTQRQAKWQSEPLPWEANNSKMKIKLKEPTPQYDANQMKGAQGEAIYRAAEQPKEFDKSFAKWIGKRDVATTTATQIGSKFKDIPKNLGMDVIQGLEDPTQQVNKNASKYIEPLHKEFDNLYNGAKEAGIDIGYRDNYITHIWDKGEDVVKREYQVFKQREFIQNDRTIPTYKEGIAMGLKPKYTHPASIIADYAHRLEKLKANLEFISEAKKKGFIVDASVGMKTPGFVPISAPGFPKSVSIDPDGKTVQGLFFAPENVAAQINKVFGTQDTGLTGRILDKTAKISGLLQDVGLSGGIPGTPMNAFTIAQVQKEILSGRIKSPISSFVRSVSPKASQKFFADNVELIKEMQARNIPIHSSFTVEDIIGKPPAGISEKGKTLWNKAMNEPTFKRFMPMLQVNLYNDIKNLAIKEGSIPQDAADVAAKAVANFYGTMKSNTAAQRTQLGKDLSKTFLFAPQYRESMVNFWVNNLKSLRHPLALENRANVKFLAGAMIMLGSMNYLNQKLNGHGMTENPPGKEDKLLIPINDGKGTVIGVPFLSSIATVPRAMFRQGKMIASGDIKGAALDAGSSYLSMGVKPIFDVAKNSDYFGKQITNETDTPGEKLAKQGQYLGSQYLAHPYLKEAFGQQNQGDPLYQRISRSTELPLRFYTQDSLNKGQFYDEYYKLKPLQEQLDTLSYKDPQKALEFAQKNADKLDRFNYLKEIQSAYYNGENKGGGGLDTSILASATQTPSAGGNESVVNSVKDINLKESVKKTGNPEVLSNGKTAFLKSNGELDYIDINPPTKGSGIDAFTNQNWQYSKARKVATSTLPDEMKQTLYKKLGVTSQEVEYDYKATRTNDIKSQYVISKANTMSHDELVNEMIKGRQESVSGSLFASNAVIDNLSDAGLISEAEAKALKKLKFDKKGKQVVGKIKAKKPKKIAIAKVAPAKIKATPKSSLTHVKIIKPTKKRIVTASVVKPTTAKFNAEPVKVSISSRAHI